MGEEVGEILLFACFTTHLPETILNIPLCHEYLCVVIFFGKRMNIRLRACPSW
jgi:hypothetical protein